ncbi:hypothetical protein TIFTF001_008426 [Ficus carica]|uniref:UDP-glycosyltransferase n=1 Tax=Ficus carica TaxID=3494 RepID=A0AA87ZT20_FICCA|nr:hypothetical protein TIFTF001_008426 [Ficus carica]
MLVSDNLKDTIDYIPDFILCNTIQELVSDTAIFALHEKPPIYAISPLVLSPLGFTKSTVPTSLMTASDCSHWLNTKPQGSVLYISFGSFLPLEKSDIEEIAHWLVLSGVDFIWVLRRNAVSYKEPYVLPFELENKINKDKGLIVQWCNQVEVISNPAIGGLLPRCGWNSILESLRYSGAPLLCFPLRGYQITNRKLVVDDWRVGLNLCDRKPLTRLEVAEKIKRLMNTKSEGDELREQVIKVRQIVGNALAKDGSCEKNLDKFADLKAKIGERSI